MIMKLIKIIETIFQKQGGHKWWSEVKHKWCCHRSPRL